MNIIRNLPNLQVPAAPVPNLALRTSNPLHVDQNGTSSGSKEASQANLGAFGNMVLDALGQTNSQIIDSQLLQQQAVVSPDSVDQSTLVISLLKADMSLSLTKAVVDRTTTAYKELTTLR